MGRMYMAPIVVAAHTAQVDYLELLAASGKPILVHGFELAAVSEVGDAQEENLVCLMKRVTGAPTSGSGGSAVDGIPLSPNDTADAATIETGNTTKLSGGTSVTLGRFVLPVRAGYLWMPPPEGRILIDASTRFVIEETTTPADSVTGPDGWVLYEELV